PNQAWTKDYSLTFALYRERAEVEYLCSEFDQAESLYPIALANAQTLLDQVTIYLIQMNQYQIQGRYAEAVEVQRTSLSLLGWEMDLEPSSLKNMLDEELQAVADYLVDRNVKDLLYLPHMQDSQKRAMMKILQAMFYAGYLIGNQTLASLTVVKMTTLSLQDGNDEFSPFGYVGYGLVAGGLGNYEIGGQFGEMAVKLSEQFDNNYIKCQTNFLFAADVHNWCRPIQESERYYDNAYRFGLESGDWVTIGYLIIQSGSDRLTSGKDLHDLYEICQAHLAFLKQVKNYDIIDLLHAGVIQPLLHLMGLATFDDEHFSETEYLEKYPNMGYYQAWFYYPKIRSAYWFDERSEWKNLIDKLEIIETYVPSHSKVPETNFYVALMHLALCDTAIESEREHHLQQAQVIEEKLQCWAKSCPENILQKLRLVQAEKARVLGQRLETMDLYDEAIAIATKHKYINNQALANELAAKYYLKIGKEKVAQPYMEEAYSCYTRWGAKAKADDLEKRYLELLAPILQVQQDRSHFNKIRFSTVDSSLVLHQTIQTSITNSSLSEALDFATVLKASQALSSEIQLEHLLCTLMKVVIENAGAKTATLVLLKDRQLFVEAIASTDDGINLISAPLESSETVPITVVNYVKRTLKTIVLHDATVQKDFIGDPYLMQKQPKSVLCAPIVHQGQFMGLLYLENSLTIGVFTNSRLEVIHLLCAQAGISLENARLYQKAQSYGQQLERSLDELKQAQLQLVQNEKMATLGNLVAGVAHEINNPIGFIQGSVTNTEQYIQDLLVHLQLYQQHYPTPVPEIREHAQDIDLEFLTADFQKLINSMKIASRRITAISDSLRTFSRADAVEKVACNIHEGIDSTLLILKYRLKASDKRPAIEVIRDYNELPLVNCFLGQLNQVF
ncbi:GAF domain-containing sensor histidine kinase, partial [Aetokthonos hydrillicola]